MGKEGGTKAGRPWQVLAAWAAASPAYFTAYVRNPRSKNPQAQMPGMPGYDDKTLAALAAYFESFETSSPGTSSPRRVKGRGKGQEKEEEKTRREARP
jgi:hypothetical protein